ncbi:MarR family winged helix-turn-helix transcriptional regulator [Kordiimonas gwangyangensis]|uniref:MarR family winged helix-turn-helix transcriptional regulator n=1 Tax=Kordiimonas gwangyangensis TaxID=288022 RepID=UPI00037F2785|nr:MarR family transcriptional regulator [Kordiimonas gwangyangensis]
MNKYDLPPARKRYFKLTDRINDPLDLMAHVPFRIATASNLLALNRDLSVRQDIDLDVREMRVLINIGSYMPIKSADIAYQSRMDSYTVSRAVKALRKAGLIDFEPVPTSKRAKNLVLTEKGEAVYRNIIDVMDRRAQLLDEVLTGDEKAQLCDMLARIESKAEQLMAQYALDQMESGVELPADQKELIRWYRKGAR